MKKFWKSFRGRRGSLYSQTIFLLTVMSVVTIVLMFAFVSRIVIRDQQERMNQVHRQQLERVSVDIDIILQSMEQSINQMIRSNDMISLMVTPKVRNSNTGYQVVSMLKTAVDQNRMLDKAFLYLPLTQDIYSSTENYVSLESSEDRQFVEDYLAIREDGRDASKESNIKLIHRDGHLFLVGDMCVPGFIGALFLEVSTSSLQDFLAGSEESLGDYFLLDRNLGIVLASEERGAALQEWLQGRTAESLTDLAVRDAEGYRFYSSEQYDLIYGIHVEKMEAMVSPAAVLLTLLPFLLVYVVFAQLYSMYISRRVYAPINRLMQITAEKRADLDTLMADQSQSELDILETSFQNAMGESEQQRELLAHISEDVAEQTFRGILMMTGTDMQHIRRTLDGIGLSRYLTGKYLALSCMIIPEKERQISTVEEELYRRSLLAILREKPSTEYLMVSFFTDSDHLAILFCVTEDVSVIRMKTLVQDKMEEIRQSIRSLPYTVIFGRGKTYNEIISLRFSYREASEEVTWLGYQARGEETEAQRPDDFGQRYFSERAEHLAESAEKDSLEDALQTAAELAEEVCATGPENRSAYLEEMTDVLMERMIKAHVTPEEIQEMEFTASAGNVSAGEDIDQLKRQVQEMFQMSVKAIHTNSRKNRFRYVDTAMEYIAEHYADGNLSLNEVSEAVGISAPYLSGIFAEVNKGGFSTYLSQYRVEQAKRFLTDTAESVSEIGYKCGFNSAQSFSRVFKKFTGISPGQFRDKNRRHDG